MADDIRLAVDFHDHPKTMLLYQRCGPQGVIGLQRIWGFCARYRPRGDLTGLEDRTIEQIAHWDGDPGRLIDGLVRCKFLDRNGNGVLVCHGWQERNPWVYHKEDRSQVARELAERRWRGRKKGQTKTVDISESNANGNANGIKIGNPPSPIPSPTPIHIKDKDVSSAIETKLDSANKIDLVPPSPLQFRCAGKIKTWNPPPEMISELKSLYPSVDIEREIKLAKLKIDQGAVTMKTSRGMPRFLLGWMERSQNSRRPFQQNTESKPDGPVRARVVWENKGEKE